MSLTAAAAIGAGASLVGSFFSSKSADKANQAAIANNAANLAAQKNFAKKGVRWRVADAKAAGIHPLYAMGASIPAFRPSPLNLFKDTSMGKGLAAAGQDIGRAVQATATAPERALSMERAALENKLLEAEIMLKTKQSQTGPAFPNAVSPGTMPGQGDFPSPIDTFPMPVNPSAPGQPWRETGAVADVGFARTQTGLTPVPSLDVKERIEDQLIPEGQWALRNIAKPFFWPHEQTPPNEKQFPPKPGYYWRFNRWAFEWQQVKTIRKLNRKQRPRRHVNPHGWDKSDYLGDTFTGS